MNIRNFDLGPSRAALFATAATILLFISSIAAASPWTLPQDELTLTMTQDFQQADREFLQDGTLQEFPLDGTYRSQSFRLEARYGFTDRFEGAMSLNISNVVYRADPVILEEFDDTPSPNEATESILDFNSSNFGAGDVRLSGRYNLLRGDLMVTTSTTAKVPTGYEPPRGTFYTDDEDRRQVGGQATLGDGQTDLTQRLLFGTVIRSTSTFIRAGLGARYRFGSPGHQGVADLQIGQAIGDALILIAGVRGDLTLLPGEVIGETRIATDPSIPAGEFTRDYVEREDLRLDRDALNVSGGVLFDLGEVEVTANYQYTPWGTNTAAIHAFTVGTIVSMPEITGR